MSRAILVMALAAGLALAASACSDTSVDSSGPGPYRDEVPPEWSPGATLVAQDVGRTHVALQWPAATDDVAVARYRLFVNGKPTKLVEGTSHLLTLLQPDTTYEVMVQAIDVADRASSNALAVAIHTRPVTRRGHGRAR